MAASRPRPAGASINPLNLLPSARKVNGVVPTGTAHCCEAPAAKVTDSQKSSARQQAVERVSGVLFIRFVMSLNTKRPPCSGGSGDARGYVCGDVRRQLPADVVVDGIAMAAP